MTIALQSFAAAANGTTSATPAYPASIANGDLILAHVTSKPFGAAPAFSTMMPQATIASGGVTNSNGSGSVNATSAARIADGTMPASETLTVASGSPTLGVLSRWTIAAGKQWALAVSTGADTVETGTGVSATGSSVHLQVNDVLVVTVAIKDDVPNHTGQAVTATGFTLSAMTWETKFSTTTGNDAAMYVGRCTVTAGTAGFVTPVYAATSSVSGASSTAVVFQRLREQDPALPGVIGYYDNPTVEPETHGRAKPVMDGNGNLYRIGESNLAHDTNRPIVSKSSDGGITWKPVDWANHPSVQDLEACWVVNDGTQFLAFTTRDDTTSCVPFRMSDHATNPDTYGTAETVDSGLSSSGVVQYVGAARLSDGQVWVFYTGLLNGSNNQISYKRRTAVNTYTTRATFDDTNNVIGASPVVGASDVTYVFYKDQTGDTLYYRTLTATGTLSAKTTVATGTAIGSQTVAFTNAVYYDDAGTEVIGVAYINDSDVLKYREIRGGVLQTEETISSAAITRNPGSTDSQSAVASLAVDGTTVYAMWSRGADGDLMRRARTLGTGWGTETVTWSSGGQTGWYIYCDIVTDGTDVKLIYTYDQGTHVDDASNITYNELVVRTTGGGGTTVNLGLATETDTSLALTRTKVDELGLATATETAPALVLAKTRTAGLASETDTAAALTLTKADELGLASETDTSLALVLAKTRTAGLASETDTAPALTSSKAAPLGLPAEAGTSSALTATKTITLGLPVETSTAHAPSIGSSTSITLELALEADTALQLVAAKTVTLGLPVDTSTAASLSSSKAASLGLAAEAGTSLALVLAKAITAGLAGETDTAHAISTSQAGGATLGLAAETSVAHALAAGKAITLGLAVETTTAPQMLATKTRTLELALETELGLALTSDKALTLGLALETSTALPIPPLVILPTPASRTLPIQGEDRTRRIEADVRTLPVPAQTRTITA